MNLEHARGPIDIPYTLDKSTYDFLKDNGILAKLLVERDRYVKVKERSIENRHMDILHNAKNNRRPQSNNNIVSNLAYLTK